MKKLVSEPDPRCSASTTRIVASIEAIVSAYEYQARPAIFHTCLRAVNDSQRHVSRAASVPNVSG
jgi:hypothetical protein